ncbi:hypothetical protein ACIGXM_02355 [Kitasatospora sp. NPDC052896]|uniref:hypothetical protein n=1 Tax=Kitasatospora sp. NPDC052896 TaxID=3364061 RepID=UPI0037CB94CE
MTTDIWGWVHDTHEQLLDSGQYRLANALAEISGHAVDGRNEQLDAMFPEALASARALGLDWVEVFLRHWRLQNLLNKRHQGEQAMAEAVSLLEFAHREETAGCPQSVCAVQDFTICHANIDGPGYVSERLAVLEETLERVEPARACFDCLSREYADTLEDDGRAEATLAHLDRAQTRIQAAGQRVSLAFGHGRASALHRLGRYEEMLAALDTAEQAHTATGRPLDDDDRRKFAVNRARGLAALGRWAEALAQLPPAEEAQEYADLRHRWADTVERLAVAGHHPNDVELGARLADWVSYLDAAGSHRPCLDLALIAGRLAVRRGARTVALALVGTAERKLAVLRRTDGVAGPLAELRAAAEALPVAALPVAPGELLDWFATRAEAGGAEEPEADLDLLAAGWAAVGEPPAGDPAPATELLLNLAALLAALGQERTGAELLWARLDADPDHPDLPVVLGSVLIEARDAEGVRRLAERLATTAPGQAYWVRARWAEAEGRWAEAAELCAALLATDPERLAPRRLAARAGTELGDHPAAQRHYQELLARAADADVEQADLWHLVTAASANRDWAVVREVAGRLGFAFDGSEGPIDEELQLVTVRARRDNGSPADLPAVRTGPATARILPVLGDEVPLNHRDVVVFTPALLEPRPGEDAPAEEREGWRPTFELLTLLDPAGYTTHWIDGGWPGPEPWAELRAALETAGYGVWAYSGSEYRISDPADEDGSLPGLYAAVGIPPTASAADADALLHRLTAHWPHPLAWLDLATAAGADPTPHQRTITRYGL